MVPLKRSWLRWSVAMLMVLALIGMLAAAGQQLRAAEETAPEPAPPEGQEYTGAKRCASCHFQQYMTWKKDKHSKSFELLPSEYQKDEKCLKCHTTGYGEPSGFKDMATTPSLAGTTCEACHGPGSKHEEVSQPFAKKKTLTPEEEKLVRDSIWMMQPGLVCVNCHTTKAHKESETPPELRKAD